jgi:hypothetical protein
MKRGKKTLCFVRHKVNKLELFFKARVPFYSSRLSGGKVGTYPKLMDVKFPGALNS